MGAREVRLRAKLVFMFMLGLRLGEGYRRKAMSYSAPIRNLVLTSLVLDALSTS